MSTTTNTKAGLTAAEIATVKQHAPKVLYMTLHTGEGGREIATLTAVWRTYTSGSQGYNFSDKIFITPDNAHSRFQVGCNVTLVGSKGAAVQTGVEAAKQLTQPVVAATRAKS